MCAVRCQDIQCLFVQDLSFGTGGNSTCLSWSDPSAWTGQFETHRIPIDGDYVRIPSFHCIIIDIPECEMPRLKFVEINGLLKSLDTGTCATRSLGVARALRAKNIWIRAGELRIAQDDGAPYCSRFTITLLDGSTDDNWAFSGSTAVGNKALVVTGLLNLQSYDFYGTKTRLSQELVPGSASISVEDASGVVGLEELTDLVVDMKLS